MERYMIETLEPKRTMFGNLPACPFARAERIARRIRYEISNLRSQSDLSEVENLIREFANDREHSTLLIVDPASTLSKDEGINAGIILCERVRDIRMVAISLHPDDRFRICGFEPRSQIPCFTMLVQADELVAGAKKTLAGTNYYVNWSEADLAFNNEQIGRFLNSPDVPTP